MPPHRDSVKVSLNLPNGMTCATFATCLIPVRLVRFTEVFSVQTQRLGFKSFFEMKFWIQNCWTMVQVATSKHITHIRVILGEEDMCVPKLVDLF
ncbi:MAG: hypothetical protein RLZZ308_671 [Candidatus Parcubacteria bacterium]